MGTCRGAFRLREKMAKEGKDDTTVTVKDDEELEKVLDDTFTCNGISTRLRHVADYPLARTKDEAVSWFEGSPVPAPDGERNSFRKRRNTKRTGSEGEQGKDFTM